MYAPEPGAGVTDSCIPQRVLGWFLVGALGYLFGDNDNAECLYCNPEYRALHWFAMRRKETARLAILATRTQRGVYVWQQADGSPDWGMIITQFLGHTPCRKHEEDPYQ